MTANRYLFTSESVTEGHPDKICDQVSDAVLDACLREDPRSRVACETATTTGVVFVAGEITTTAQPAYEDIARKVLREIGYTDAAYGIGADTCAILQAVHRQSPDIAQGVDIGGAGDQGMMVGYATDETPEFMPSAILYAHKLTQRLAEARKKGIVKHLRPDGKSQVTLEYVDDEPVRASAVVVAAQHDGVPRKEDRTAFLERLRSDIRKHVIEPVFPKGLLDDRTEYYINQTGWFEVGGPHGDSGLTGRKIIVDTYGGYAPHGGGAFSGKDPTKVDRSAAYATRWIAKNVVAAGIARRCQIQVAYCIGHKDPVSVHVTTFGTGVVSDEEVEGVVRKTFDLTPGGIIDALQLRRPIYRQTAAYGHFGRTDIALPWEATDRVSELKGSIKGSARLHEPTARRRGG